ncbi:hypothetical protein B0T25DRAFT_620651 [Lasiosphaeria hispida]|uniref:Rhodopsin domain-containing protein n=1 Tax=Lasiosphaeria hispida TaxID=260671 RepID=A0AAJ0MH15_9PEZI|nr:hypothetical protein B0T25DRAFT_620651 [Lasiosphaeria hispida]
MESTEQNMTIRNATAPVVIDPVRAAESNTAQLLSVLTVFHIVALIFVSLRIYVRVFVIKTSGKDDVCMVLAALCAMGGWVIFLYQSQYGLGKHVETIAPPDMVVLLHTSFWQSIITASCALCLLKLSIGFNLLRLSMSRWYSWSVWATMILVVGYSFMGAMTFFLHCTPMQGHWDVSLAPTCYSTKLYITFALINTSFNITTDVLFASFPIPIIWSLQLKRRVRLYLVGILSLGYFAVATGVVKAVYQIAFSNEPDKTFGYSIQLWGFLQLNIGIIAACAATLKPLVNRVLSLGSTHNNNNNNNNNNNMDNQYVYTADERGMMRRRQLGGGTAAATSGTESEGEGSILIELGRTRASAAGVYLGLAPGSAMDTPSSVTSFYKEGESGDEESGDEEPAVDLVPVVDGWPRQPPRVAAVGDRGFERTTKFRENVR